MPTDQMDLDVKSTAQVTKQLFAKPTAVIGSGGGVLGIAEAGALHALTINHVLSETKLLIGSSIAAFMLTLKALSISFDNELKKLISREIDVRKFLDISWGGILFILIKTMQERSSYFRYDQLKLYFLLYKFINNFLIIKKGIFEGLYIEQIIHQKVCEALSIHSEKLIALINVYLQDANKRALLLKKEIEDHHNQWSDNHLVHLLIELKKTLEGKNSLTLGGLHLLNLLDPYLGFQDLVISALNTSMKPAVLEFFSYKSKPHLAIKRAVHASMAIPYIYAAVEIDGCFYQDGGLAANTPLSYFQQQENMKGKEYLIIDFGSAPKFKPAENVVEHCWRLLGSFLAGQKSYFRKEDYERTIYLNRLGVSPINFFLSAKTQEKLFYKGFNTAVAFLKDKQFGF